VDLDNDFDVDSILVAIFKNGVRHKKLKAAIKAGQAVREVCLCHSECGALVM